MLAGGAKCDHNPYAFHILRGQRAQSGEINLAQVGKAPLSLFTARRAPATGLDHGAPPFTEGGDVGLRGRMAPHGRIHGGGDDGLAPEGKGLASQQLVRLALRQPRDGSGGGGGDDEGLRHLPRFEMGEGRGSLRIIEGGRVYRGRAECGERQRRDEFLGGGGQGRADGNARVLPLAHEIERAVCGDGPAHSEMEAGPADAAKGEMGVHYWLRPCWCTPPPEAPVPVEVSGVR